VCSDCGSGVGEEAEGGTAKFRVGSGAEETQDNRRRAASIRTMYVLFLTVTIKSSTAHCNSYLSYFTRTWVSRYQKGKPVWINWSKKHCDGVAMVSAGPYCTQVCISLQTVNHAGNPPLSLYRLDALPAAQPTALKQALNSYH